MHLQAVQRVLGLLLMVFSLTMLPPVLVSLLYADGQWDAFLASFFALIMLGGLVWLPVRRNRDDLRRRDGALIVSLFWAGLGVVGAVPLLLTQGLEISITDAVFESVSGLTTTGATVIVGLDDLPKSILFYRQLLQWLGGMGIIVLAVAILPLLGIGGMQLYRAETPGPTKDNKLTPRITETAKTLWMIYVGLTGACALAYWLAGMTLFDAIAHSFSTIAIGGFSTHDLSAGFFDNTAIDVVATVFMIIAGTNFALHFTAVRNGSIRHYWKDPEFRAYLSLLIWLTAFVTTYLLTSSYYDGHGLTFVRALFHVVSITTTTGFATDDFAAWPGMLPVLLILSSFVGACAYSTGGGMKVIRWVLLVSQGQREVRRLIHPHAQFVTKLGKRSVSEKVVSAVWGFFSMYVAVFSVLMLATMAAGMDHVAAFSAVAACLNNLGPGLGEVAANYKSVPDLAKWLLMMAMLLGRLEIFTLLVILTPAFWRK